MNLGTRMVLPSFDTMSTEGCGNKYGFKQVMSLITQCIRLSELSDEASLVLSVKWYLILHDEELSSVVSGFAPSKSITLLNCMFVFDCLSRGLCMLE